jgi:hypothetical protein
MSLTAFTNEPGDHSRSEFITGYQRGKYYGSDNLNEVIYSEAKAVESASKWFPTPGYAGCTDWSRSVRKFTVNDPAGWRRHETVGNPPNEVVIIELEGDHHLTIDYQLGGYPVPDPGTDNAHDRSVTQALNNLTQHYAGLGADLGQAREACDSFSAIAIRCANLLMAIKERRLDYLKSLFGHRGRESISKNLADLWLEYSYGWKPLAADLYAEQQIVHEFLKQPVPIKAMSTAHSSNNVQFQFDQLLVDGSSQSSHRTVLLAHMTNPYLAGLNQAGLLNPVSIAWELVPFSFVVDWFVPIGSTLQAITAGVGLESDGGFTSSRYATELNIRHTTDPNHFGNGFWYDKEGHLQEKAFAFHRQCYADFPPPKLYANVTPYSTARALNALALLRQLV